MNFTKSLSKLLGIAAILLVTTVLISGGGSVGAVNSESQVVQNASWNFDRSDGQATVDGVTRIEDEILGNFKYVKGVRGEGLPFVAMGQGPSAVQVPDLEPTNSEPQVLSAQEVDVPVHGGTASGMTAATAASSDGDVLNLRKTGDVYRIVLSTTGRELAVVGPDVWQGNMNILSPSGARCGVVWPHFLMNSEGEWLTDQVESEGMKLVDFEVLKPSGSVVGYRGKWSFRDYFQSSETHFTWYEPTELTQVHLIRTRLRILKDLEGITTTWVEFMTRENSYTTAASMTKGGEVLTMDVGGTGEKRNMHHWDGNELDPNGWITIYDCKNDQAGCAAMVPLRFSTRSIHPRINNGHVDNIEIHMLDARKRNNLKKGQEVFLEYLFFAGPDRKDSKWIAHSVKQARSFMKQFELFNRP